MDGRASRRDDSAIISHLPGAVISPHEDRDEYCIRLAVLSEEKTSPWFTSASAWVAERRDAGRFSRRGSTRSPRVESPSRKVCASPRRPLGGGGLGERIFRSRVGDSGQFPFRKPARMAGGATRRPRDFLRREEPREVHGGTLRR